MADVNSEKSSTQNSSSGWLNRTVLGVGVTSLFSDWSHEIATAILPAFLATIGAGPAWLGAIEGIADGLSSFAKLSSGHYTDQLKKRKPLAVFGYAFTALATASFAFATHAYHVLFGRAAAWLGRGIRSPAKKALLARSSSQRGSVTGPARWPRPASKPRARRACDWWVPTASASWFQAPSSMPASPPACRPTDRGWASQTE